MGPLTSFEIVIGAPSASFVETGSVATAIGRHLVFVDVAVGDVNLVPGSRSCHATLSGRRQAVAGRRRHERAAAVQVVATP